MPDLLGKRAPRKVIQQVRKAIDNPLGRAIRPRDLLRLDRGLRDLARPITRSQIGYPHPINAVADCDVGVRVAKVAAEQARLVLPADTIADAPLRRDARGNRRAPRG